MQTRKIDWGKIVPTIAMLTLSFGASIGVYSVMRQFGNPIIAGINATSFELTYLGLAMADKNTAAEKKKARNVSIGAVLVSILMGVTAGWVHKYPGLAESTNAAWNGYLAVLHGLPLALLAYQMSSLIIHKDGSTYDTLMAEKVALEATLEAEKAEKETLKAEKEAAEATASAVSAQLEALQNAPAAEKADLTAREVGAIIKKKGWQLPDIALAVLAAHRNDKTAAAKAFGTKPATLAGWAEKGRL